MGSPALMTGFRAPAQFTQQLGRIGAPTVLCLDDVHLVGGSHRAGLAGLDPGTTPGATSRWCWWPAVTRASRWRGSWPRARCWSSARSTWPSRRPRPRSWRGWPASTSRPTRRRALTSAHRGLAAGGPSAAAIGPRCRAPGRAGPCPRSAQPVRPSGITPLSARGAVRAAGRRRRASGCSGPPCWRSCPDPRAMRPSTRRGPCAACGSWRHRTSCCCRWTSSGRRTASTHLYREFLATELEAHLPGELTRVATRASRWAMEQRDVHAAVRLAHRSGDLDLLALQVERALPAVFWRVAWRRSGSGSPGSTRTASATATRSSPRSTAWGEALVGETALRRPLADAG